jgi:hypothetical protein
MTKLRELRTKGKIDIIDAKHYIYITISCLMLSLQMQTHKHFHWMPF